MHSRMNGSTRRRVDAVLRRAPHPGALVACGLLGLFAGAFWALLSAAGDRSTLLSIGPYLLRVLGFSLLQAAISTLLSVILGTALALALARRRFPGRGLVLAALSAAAVMPAIVVVFSVLTVYGRTGWLSDILSSVGVGAEIPVFGWPGILVAHVFLNAPLVARATADAVATAPAEHWRLAASLGFSSRQVWRHIDLPILKSQLPGVATLVFFLCFTSFAIVLSLGGGPARATLEVAIYEALKIDLDFGRAAWLAFVQVALCLSLSVLLHWAVEQEHLGHTLREPIPRPDTQDPRLAVLDWFVLALAGLLILPLLLSVLSSLASLQAVLDRELALAFLTSLLIAVSAAVTACLLALALAAAARRHRLERRPRAAALYDALPAIVLTVPPFALVAGLFLMVRRFMDPASAGFLLLPLVNGLSALPFAYSFINPRLASAGERYGRLTALLGLSGWTKLALVDWPVIRRPLAAAFAMSMALSFGDFGVVALFGGTELRTLPYLLYERLGAYRFDEAGALGCLIVLFAFCLAYVSGRFAHAESR